MYLCFRVRTYYYDKEESMAAIKKKQSIALDTLLPFSGRVLDITAEDTGSVLEITLLQNGEELLLGSDSRVVLAVASCKGLRTQDSAQSGGGVAFTPGTGVVEIALKGGSYGKGMNLCSLQLYTTENETEDTLISAVPFSFTARPAPITEEAVESDTAFPALTEAAARCVGWFFGTAVTGEETGIAVTVTGSRAGDCYLNTETGNVYRLAAGGWNYLGCLMGPTGATGPAGADGSGSGESWELLQDITLTEDVAQIDFSVTGMSAYKKFYFDFAYVVSGESAAYVSDMLNVGGIGNAYWVLQNYAKEKYRHAAGVIRSNAAGYTCCDYVAALHASQLLNLIGYYSKYWEATYALTALPTGSIVLTCGTTLLSGGKFKLWGSRE